MDPSAQFHFYGCFGFEGLLFLLLVVIEYCVHVLSIPGATGRPVARPEDIQQVGIGNFLGIVVNLNDFGVVSDMIVIRIGCLPPGIPYAGSKNAVDDPELGLYSPESTQSECGRIELCRDLRIDKWHGRLQLHFC